MNDKLIEKTILDFLSTKPDVIDAIGYGSGVKTQDGYAAGTKKQIDIIATVDDDYTWHDQNMKINPQDYSKIGYKLVRPFLHVGTDINYLTHLEHNGQTFKLGIVSKSNFNKDLDGWKNFYVAGRMQKPIEVVKGTESLANQIELNRLRALKIALILNIGNKINLFDLYQTLISLSYIGDIRMVTKFENPKKIKNIIRGSFNEIDSVYSKLNDQYFIDYGTELGINIMKLVDELDTLPPYLLKYINDHNVNLEKDSINDIKILILKYFRDINLKASTCQPIKGFLINGPVKSLNYLLEKKKKAKM